MPEDKKETGKSAEEPVKDLEVLSDEDLESTSGGRCGEPCMGCVACVSGCNCGGGGGCGTCKTTHEANFKLDPSGKGDYGDRGDVVFDPKKMPDLPKKK